MKLIAIFTFCSVMVLQAGTAYSQKERVSLDIQNSKISDVLKEIENQTDYLFFYNHKEIESDRAVTMKEKNRPVNEVLDKLFTSSQVKYEVVDKHIVLTKAKQEKNQGNTITGVIVDEYNEPLAGVTVVVKGTNTGVITNPDGIFSIQAPKNSALLISYIGYTTIEVSVGTKTHLNIQLKENTQALDEVVVTAYGTSKRAAITGAIAVVNTETLERNKATNITSGLQGLVAGVQVVASSGQPGAEQNILIRGLGSYTADSKPLYIVDGVPLELSINSISSSDIESISVLKDAAAASLYGARAANGVILITTKKGKSGEAKVDFYATWGTSEMAVPFPKKNDPTKQWENVWWGLYNDATDFKNMNDADARQYAHDNVSAQFYSERNIQLPDGTTRKYHSGWDTDYPIGLDGKLKPGTKRLWDFNIYDEFFSHRLKQEYGVSATGAMGDKNRYYVSLSYLDDKGSYLGDGYKRYTGRMNLETKIKSWLTMNNAVMYTTSNNSNKSFDVRPIRTMSRENTIYIYDYMTGGYKERAMNPGQLAIDNSQETGRRAWGGYAMGMDQLYRERDILEQNLQTNTSLTAQIYKDLTFKTVYSYQMYNSFNVDDTPPDNGALLDQVDWGNISRGSTNTVSNYFNNVLTYDKTLQDHHINILAGQEAHIWNRKSVYASRGGLLIPYFKELQQATSVPDVNSTRDEYKLLSFFTKAQYDYKNKYYINFSYRMDGSSKFSPESRWGNFFSVGGAWSISREEFMNSTSDWLNVLKLKASYGELGNDNVRSLYAYQGYYDAGNNYYYQLGMVPTQLPNPDLKWETNINTNAGIEFTIFDRFSGSFEVFSRKSKDLLMDMPLPTSTGRDGIYKNIGDIQNTGYEIELRYDIIKRKEMLWSIHANASHFKNKIVSLPFGTFESQTDIDGESGVAYYRWEEGGSRYDMYCSEWAGVNPDNGRNQWWKKIFDENGKVVGKEKTEDYSEVRNMDQRVNVGSSLPKLYGSFGTDFQYKGFDLSLMFYYSLGGKVYDYNYAESSVLRESWANYPAINNSWRQPGDITNYPKPYQEYAWDAYSANNIGSSQWVFKNDFIRLKNLVVGYTIPENLSSKVGVGKLRVYFRGENLFTTGKLASHGSDPEAGGIWGQNKSGLTYFATRNYNLGINITFK